MIVEFLVCSYCETATEVPPDYPRELRCSSCGNALAVKRGDPG